MQGVRWTEEDLKAHQAKRAKSHLVAVPSTPVPAPANAVQPAGKRKMKRPEQALQIEAIKFLDVALPPSWRVVHIPNGVADGGEQAMKANAIRKAMGARAGFPDLMFVGRGGRLVVAETKAGKGDLNDNQEEWRDWCLANDVPWFIFRSIDELVAGCVDAGIPLRVRA